MVKFTNEDLNLAHLALFDVFNAVETSKATTTMTTTEKDVVEAATVAAEAAAEIVLCADVLASLYKDPSTLDKRRCRSSTQTTVYGGVEHLGLGIDATATIYVHA